MRPRGELLGSLALTALMAAVLWLGPALPFTADPPPAPVVICAIPDEEPGGGGGPFPPFQPK